MVAKTSDFEVGTWYKVEIPVQSSKTYVGRLMRAIETKDNGVVILQMQGRFPFSVLSDEVISIEQTDEPKTGVPRELRSATG